MLSTRIAVMSPAIAASTPSVEQQDAASPRQVPVSLTPEGTNTVVHRQELFSDLLHNLNDGIWNTFPPFSLTDIAPEDPIPLRGISGTQEILSETNDHVDDSLSLLISSSRDPMDVRPTGHDHIGDYQASEGSDDYATEVLSILTALYRLQNHQNSVIKASADQILPALRESTIALSNLIKRSDQIGRQQDDCITFMLATVASKILSWYRDVYESAICSLTSVMVQERGEGARQLLVPNKSSSRNCRRTWIIPLSIGEMQLPPATERRMKAQMLLCELQPLGQACTDLSQHMRSVNDFRSEAHVCDMFDKHLQRGLNELQKSLEAV